MPGQCGACLATDTHLPNLFIPCVSEDLTHPNRYQFFVPMCHYARTSRGGTDR
jgi:hypothetical protein